MTAETVVIDQRFRGPPASGHGGYTCGLLARMLPGAVEVSLRSPPPLERPLSIEQEVAGRFTLRDGETLVAQARAADLEVAVPDPIALDEATSAISGYVGFEHHAFPSCFACGPERGEGDGLRLFPGSVSGRDIVACPWRPGADLAGGDGLVQPEFVWAALDCPTAFACDLGESWAIVLAQLTAKIERPVRAEAPHVVAAWPLGREGRKHSAACAIFDQEGEVLAVSRALWIEPRDRAAFGAAG
ncbi:MAG: hypothetical protein KGJ43_04365 [Acidobacteriota bacterium]|nr:hypothetical protein [Acidobacteriota bacterium]